MFTIFTDYLLGRQQVNKKETTEERLTTLEADDDWLLIDKAISSIDNGSDSDLDHFAFEYLPSLETPVNSVPHFLPAMVSLQTDYHESPFSMEESWFLTPPPCFTSAGPIFVETSPLENLLIEHPSMSVYQNSSIPKLSLPPLLSFRHCPSPHGSVTSDQEEEEDIVVIDCISSRRLMAILMEQRRDEKQNARTASAQKIRQCQENSTLKRNKLVRTNKAREANSTRNKRQRRSDRQRHHSGANNNRKCC